MKTLDRHIGISLAFGFLLVALILAVLFSFIEIVLEIDDIGKGNYRIQDVFYYVTLTAPRRTLDLLPLSALLGSILAMGHLADGNELGWNWDRVNVNGGAVALGHPVGSSGCRIVVTLAHEMKRRGSKYGLATLCAEGGQGSALVIEAIAD